ncbi:MAG: YfiR family protein [Candidatus Berkiella sp.]
MKDVSKQMGKMNRYLIGILLSAALLSSPAKATEAQDTVSSGAPQEAREYHLKAAFLRYVAKFVEWPPESLPEGAVNICVLGQVPYYKGLDSITGKDANDRIIQVMKVGAIEDAEKQKCQILFVAKTESDKVGSILKVIQDKPILSFGDMDDFAEKGGDMNFYIMNKRLAIMINPPAVERSNLKISPRMLKLVTVVPPIEQEGVYN